MNEATKQERGRTTRRALIGGLGAVAVGVGLVACSGGQGGGDAAGSTDSTDSTSPTSGPPSPAGGGDGAADQAAIRTTDIPVGGGKIYADLDTVVTQPNKGDFKAFTATCTHQGCIVANVSGGTINCGCHGSRFSIADGSVTQAAQGLTPQTQNPLPSKSVTVTGTTISVI